MKRPPNLLVILSDQHQAKAMSCEGHPVAQTPNLDALAERGTRFTNAYTPSPICVPARAAFATGRHVHDIRNWDNAMPYVGNPKGWGHALQEKGVRVESIGKLHYRKDTDDAGFDVQHVAGIKPCIHLHNGNSRFFVARFNGSLDRSCATPSR